MLTSTACASGFLSRAPASPSTPFNPGPQWSELVKHSDVPVDIGHAAFAGNGAREKEHAPFPWLSLLMFWACEQRERSSQAPAFDAGVHDINNDRLYKLWSDRSVGVVRRQPYS